MTRRTLVRSVLAALGLFFVCASGSDAAAVSYHGSLCNPEAPAGSGFAPVSDFGYNQYGVHNASGFGQQGPAAPGFVVCGGAHEFNATVTAVTVIVYDRHPSQNVVCSVVGVNLLGDTVFMDTQSSTGVQSLFQQLDFFPGVAAATFALGCEIPPHDAFSGFSHVTTYSVTTP